MSNNNVSHLSFSCGLWTANGDITYTVAVDVLITPLLQYEFNTNQNNRYIV